jgi:preprotein translocase subunit SecY
VIIVATCRVVRLPVRMLPSLLADQFNVQFYFGGTSLLIVVGVALETFRQIDAHRQSLRYESFLKQGTIRARGR